MILVTGSITARPETLDRLIELSLEHVKRSRHEPGCRLHSVHRDLENPSRLVFLEHWSDLESLQAHFAEPESRAFARLVAELAAEPPTLEIYRAQALPLPGT